MMMTAAAAAPVRSFRVFARIMALSLTFPPLARPLMYLPLGGTAQRPPKRCSGVQIVSASHSGDKSDKSDKRIKEKNVGWQMCARRRHDRCPLLAQGSLGALRSQGGFRIA